MIKITYVQTKRSKVVHAVNPENTHHTLCGWGNDHRREPTEYSSVDFCFDCAAKLRELCPAYHTPMLKREGKDRFRRLPKSLLDSIRLEAAQKGYWGIL